MHLLLNYLSINDLIQVINLTYTVTLPIAITSKVVNCMKLPVNVHTSANHDSYKLIPTLTELI